MPLTKAYVQVALRAARTQAAKRSSVKAMREMLGDSPAIEDLMEVENIKNVGTYTRVLRRLLSRFYDGKIDAFQFTNRMSGVIFRQYRLAWNAGARDVGFKPRDMTDADRFELFNRIDAETNHILDFAEAIEQARLMGEPKDALLARVDLWANRFNEVENDARVYFGAKYKPEIHLIWLLGKTEEHCPTCFALNGVVATAAEWNVSGIDPQNGPNDRLECGGWNCDCRRIPTIAPLTDGGIPAV